MSSSWMFALLGAAGLTLAMAVFGTFVARANLLEAGASVRHTSEVQLAIADCRVHLRDTGIVRTDRDGALAAAIAAAERVRQLTHDSPAQQIRAADLLARLHRHDEPGAAEWIDRALLALAAVEGSLMDSRSATLARSTRTGWLVLGVSASLTLLIVGLFVAMLLRQSGALTRAQADVTQKGAMLESIIDAIDDGIMAITPDRKVLHYKGAARRLLGEQFPLGGFPKDWRAVLECVYKNGTSMKPEEGALERAVAGQSTDNLVYKTRQRAVVVDRVDRGLAKHDLTSGTSTPLSLSIGISFFNPRTPASVAELMIDADRLMYSNKRERRRERA